MRVVGQSPEAILHGMDGVTSVRSTSEMSSIFFSFESSFTTRYSNRRQSHTGVVLEIGYLKN